MRHLVSELVTGAEKKTASRLTRLEKLGKTLAESVEANAVMLRQLVERPTEAGAGSETGAERAAKLLERIETHAADFGRWMQLERRGSSLPRPRFDCRGGLKPSQVPCVDVCACLGSQTPRSPDALTTSGGRCCLRPVIQPRHSELRVSTLNSPARTHRYRHFT